jgi:hypothetical protein
LRKPRCLPDDGARGRQRRLRQRAIRPRAADIRAWFKSVIAPNGVPCCDISDGHRTEYRRAQRRYWVPIEGTWMEVPDRAIIRDRGNPVGQAVVW